MSRRRYISTDISTDPRLADLAEHGVLPVLLYTWAIAHADDWGRMTGDARQFKLLVCPGLDVTARDVDVALTQIADVGLWLRYTVEGRAYLAFPSAAWFRYQTYIGCDKRTHDGSAIPAPSDPAYRLSPQETAYAHVGAPDVRGDVRGDVTTEACRDDASSASSASDTMRVQQRVTPRMAEDRRRTPQNATERRATPLHARTPSPSPSPSPSPPPTFAGEQGDTLEREQIFEGCAADAALVLVAPAASSSSFASSSSPASAMSAPKVTPLPMAGARVRDPVWDACIAAMGLNGAAPSNRVERGKWTRGIQALKESLAAEGSPPSEIITRARRYRTRFGRSVPLNPMALAGNWTQLATDIPLTGQEGQRYGEFTAQRSFAGSAGRSSGRFSGRYDGRAGKPQIGSPEYYEQAEARACAQQHALAKGGAAEGQRNVVEG
jgi:hypothetical protein